MNNTPPADGPSPVVEPNVVARDLVTQVGRNSGSGLSTMLKPGRRRNIGTLCGVTPNVGESSDFSLGSIPFAGSQPAGTTMSSTSLA